MSGAAPDQGSHVPDTLPQATLGRLVRQGVGKLLMRIFMLSVFAVGKAFGAGDTSGGYEIEGVINQTAYQYDRYHINVKAEFKVCVRDCQWLIQTAEVKTMVDERGEKPMENLKREVGSTNGAEIFELVTPHEGDFRTATIVSNDVAFGQMDGSVIGHLWLMLASQCYLSRQETNLLVPVYLPMLQQERRLKEKATWELLSGAGSLPRNVTYFNKVGGTDAVYRVTEVTNINGVEYPTGFTFDRDGKRATARVTAIKPVCSLASLLPVLTGKTAISDRRTVGTNPATRMSYISYMAYPSSGFPTTDQAKQAHEQKQTTRTPPSVRLSWWRCFLPHYAFQLWWRFFTSGGGDASLHNQ